MNLFDLVDIETTGTVTYGRTALNKTSNVPSFVDTNIDYKQYAETVKSIIFTDSIGEVGDLVTIKYVKDMPLLKNRTYKVVSVTRNGIYRGLVVQ